MKMESDQQRAIRMNRPDCLKLKYPIIASRLISAQILTEAEHGNIKSLSQDNIDRMDELIGYLHRCDSKPAFDAFVAGVRDCNVDSLADRLESDHSTGNNGGDTTENLNIGEENDEDFDGITVSTSIFEVPNTNSETLIDEIDSQPSACSSSQGISSSSQNAEEAQVTDSGVPEGSPFLPSYRRTPELRTPMTFQQALTRQRYGRVDFYFSNSSASVESIHSNPNAGVTYMGCLEEIGIDTIRTCTRRVTERYDIQGVLLYVCDFGHARNTFIPIPRLKVTFKDDSGVLTLTLFRENVEVFLEMSTSDMIRLEPTELISVFECAKTKMWNLQEVLCEKRRNVRYPWDNYVHSICKIQNSTTEHNRSNLINSAKRARTSH